MTINLPFNVAKKFIEEGDMLLFRGKSIISWIIGRAGESTYSHVALATWHNGDKKHLGLLECVEYREGYGGRVVSLEQYVKQNSGRIDVYRPTSPMRITWFDTNLMRVLSKDVVYHGKKITDDMRRVTGLPYGWRRIWWIMQHKLPFIRAFYNVRSVMNDNDPTEVYPVCSTIIQHFCRKWGCDFVHNRSDQFTEPADIARSSGLAYLFSLTSE